LDTLFSSGKAKVAN